MSLMCWEPFRDTDEFFRRAWPGEPGWSARPSETATEPAAVD